MAATAEAHTNEMTEMIARAKAAQAQIAGWSQEQVDEMVAAAGWKVYREDHAAACAKLAFEETGMGIYKDKLLKHRKKILGTLRDLQDAQTCGVIEEIPEKGLLKVAKPVGVVGALIPVTNPTSSVGCNGLSILKGRNAVIFAPHPKGKQCSCLAARYLREGLKKIGAPEDLVQCITEPSIELTGELMSAVDLVVATGGAGMVKAAYSSGTPAYGVGAGNATVIVDETADIADAAHKVFLGKSFDNATSCSSENSLVIQKDIYESMLTALEAEGGYRCTADEKAKLQAVMWPDGKLNREIVAQPAARIAELAGIALPEDRKFLMVEAENPDGSDPFAGEKLSVVLTLWRYGDFAQAIDLVRRITGFSGYGHSCGIHTNDEARVRELALEAPVSRIMVRQPQSYANSGNYDNGMPFSLTLGCGSWGGNITTENITHKHFLNITWVSSPIEPVVPDEERIFGAHWKKWGHQ